MQGAGYTDVHARMPAMTILFFLSLAAAVILLVNVRSQGWSLPAVAVGLWVFVALVIGVLYPTFLQTLKVTPNQGSLEAPYIQRNIEATRAAFNLDKVKYHTFAGATTISNAQIKVDAATLDNIRLWDPSKSIALATVTKRQSIRSYYTFTTLSVDRYVVNGKVTPVLIGARQLNTANLPSPSWVNTHLQYTHGEGAAVIAANEVDSTTGNPNFVVSNVPPLSTNGMPTLTQPGIYFGINDNGWVVANTKQNELDYQVNSGVNAGQNVATHYKGSGGVAVGGHLQPRGARAAPRGLQLPDLEPDHPKSRVLFVRDVQQMAQKAAPFLTFEPSPTPSSPTAKWSTCSTATRRRASTRTSQKHQQPGRDRRQPRLQHQLRAQLGEGGHQRLHRFDEVLRRRPRRTDHPGLRSGVSQDVPAR